MKYLLITVAVVLLSWLAWTQLPGLRTKVSGTVDEYGGWTEEARRDDPVGFLTYAEQKLGSDIESFRKSREALAATKANAEAELQRNAGLLTVAEELATQFREQFKLAESAGAWPIQVAGASYEREALIEQVTSILVERDTYARVIDTYTDVVTSAEAQRKELRSRIQSSEATLVELRAQKELVRVNKLTADADALLAQVDTLINGNSETLVALDEPRSVEALLAATKAAPQASAPSSALDFLGAE